MDAIRKVASLLLLAGCCLAGGDASAQKRVALVIGNSSYDKAPRLDNLANDAGLMAETFESADFDHVELRRDQRDAPRIALAAGRPPSREILHFQGSVPLDEHPVQLLRAYEIVLRLVAVI
jgi:hypothetical protein